MTEGPTRDFATLPGSANALALGCICSPNQNRNGAGVQRPGGWISFATLPWCRLHGIEQALEAITRGEAHPF
jgi:hypothetical protein